MDVSKGKDTGNSESEIKAAPVRGGEGLEAYVLRRRVDTQSKGKQKLR